MQSIGKTIILELPELKNEMVDGILIPKSNELSVIYFYGIVRGYGTGWSKDEIEQLSHEIPLNHLVYFNWRKKFELKKIRFKNSWYMILPKDLILVKELQKYE